MTETVSNDLIYALLKNMQTDLGIVKRDVGDCKLRLGSLEDHTAALVTSVAGVNHRLDHHDDRLDRIEKRLGLIDA